VDRGRPVARLEPINGLDPDDDSRLGRLVRDGIVRPARAAVPKALLATKPPRLKKGASGVARLECEGALDESGVTQAFDRLKHRASGWHEVDPSDSIREAAVRFLRVHLLRAAGALRLPQHSSQQNVGRHHLMSSRSTIVWLLPHARKDSY
jgi:hypothetical protein